MLLFHRPASTLARQALTLGLAVALLGTSSGCSYIFSRGPQSRMDATGELSLSAGDCTTSAAPAVLDSMVAAPTLLGGTLAVGAGASDPYAKQFLPAALLFLGLGIVYFASAGTGFARAADCRRVKQPQPTEPAVAKQAAQASTSPISP
jgi:hypothetical protein